MKKTLTKLEKNGRNPFYNGERLTDMENGKRKEFLEILKEKEKEGEKSKTPSIDE